MTPTEKGTPESLIPLSFPIVKGMEQSFNEPNPGEYSRDKWLRIINALYTNFSNGEIKTDEYLIAKRYIMQRTFDIFATNSDDSQNIVDEIFFIQDEFCKLEAARVLDSLDLPQSLEERIRLDSANDVTSPSLMEIMHNSQHNYLSAVDQIANDCGNENKIEEIEAAYEQYQIESITLMSLSYLRTMRHWGLEENKSIEFFAKVKSPTNQKGQSDLMNILLSIDSFRNHSKATKFLRLSAIHRAYRERHLTPDIVAGLREKFPNDFRSENEHISKYIQSILDVFFGVYKDLPLDDELPINYDDRIALSDAANRVMRFTHSKN